MADNVRLDVQVTVVESGLHQNWMRDYDPTTGRYVQADPLGLVDGASVYGYARQNPGRYVDPRGEEIRLYTSGQAFGVPLFNHAFLYGTECACGTGTDGSSGSEVEDGIGNRTNRPYTPIPLPDGVTEREFIAQISRAPSMNGGLYFPIINDCHSQLRRAFEYYGYEYPGAPNGRTDIDDTIVREIPSDWQEWTRILR